MTSIVISVPSSTPVEELERRAKALGAKQGPTDFLIDCKVLRDDRSQQRVFALSFSDRKDTCYTLCGSSGVMEAARPFLQVLGLLEGGALRLRKAMTIQGPLFVYGDFVLRVGRIMHLGVPKAVCIQVTYTPVASQECAPLVLEFLQGFMTGLPQPQGPKVPDSNRSQSHGMCNLAHQYIQLLVDLKVD